MTVLDDKERNRGGKPNDGGDVSSEVEQQPAPMTDDALGEYAEHRNGCEVEGDLRPTIRMDQERRDYAPPSA